MSRPLPPVVTFQPNGHDQFMALMMYMVGVKALVTYVTYDWNERTNRYDKPKVHEFRGEVIAVSDEMLRLTALGLPSRYNKSTHYREIAWSGVKMLEVIG